MSIFTDLLEKASLKAIVDDVSQAAFKMLLNWLDDLSKRTDVDADNIALKALLKACVEKLDEMGVPDEQ